MTIQDKQFKVLLDASEIQGRIEEMSKQISSDYATNPPLFIGVLNGVFMFAAELFKNLTIQAEITNEEFLHQISSSFKRKRGLMSDPTLPPDRFPFFQETKTDQT